jgi:phosphoserine phosphatase
MKMSKSLHTAKQIWKQAKAVCFDVDSTVVTEEGIDVLAEFCGAGQVVAEWTRKAMGGSVPFHIALEERLKLIKPSKQQIESCLQKHPLILTSGMEDLAKTLHNRGTHVYLVSGGFRQMIDGVAKKLHIPQERIFANRILFDPISGSYAGFDENEPTSRAGGKAKVVGLLKEKHKYNPIVMIGDGATDLEARPPADLFIGFGGIVVRENVKKGSDWFVTDFKELIQELNNDSKL